MRLALFDNYRLGVVAEAGMVDVTSAVPGWDTAFATNSWVRLCHSFESLRPRIEEVASRGHAVPLTDVRLRAPVLNPSKIVAAASNYGAHVDEMRSRGSGGGGWELDFDVFLKAPSAIIGPEDTIQLPDVGDREVHHESELAFVIGKSAKNVPVERALEYVLGYTILVDVTVRGEGDRSRRKSYDGFCPIGPWITTADEVGDPHALEIRLHVNNTERQRVNTGTMLTKIPAMIAYASRVMTLNPGDVLTTGSPAGVGKVEAGDTIVAEIEKIGLLRVKVGGGAKV